MSKYILELRERFGRREVACETNPSRAEIYRIATEWCAQYRGEEATSTEVGFTVVGIDADGQVGDEVASGVMVIDVEPNPAR